MARAFGIAWRTRALEHYTGYDVDGRGVRESPLVGLEMEAGGEGNTCRGKLPCTSKAKLSCRGVHPCVIAVLDALHRY